MENDSLLENLPNHRSFDVDVQQTNFFTVSWSFFIPLYNQQISQWYTILVVFSLTNPNTLTTYRINMSRQRNSTPTFDDASLVFSPLSFFPPNKPYTRRDFILCSLVLEGQYKHGTQFVLNLWPEEENSHEVHNRVKKWRTRTKSMLLVWIAKKQQYEKLSATPVNMMCFEDDTANWDILLKDGMYSRLYLSVLLE